MMMTRMKDVTMPMDTVLINALGTTTPGFLNSSARCTALSIPAYMQFGETRPVRNAMPLDQPLSLRRVVHTDSVD